MMLASPAGGECLTMRIERRVDVSPRAAGVRRGVPFSPLSHALPLLHIRCLLTAVIADSSGIIARPVQRRANRAIPAGEPLPGDRCAITRLESRVLARREEGRSIPP